MIINMVLKDPDGVTDSIDQAVRDAVQAWSQAAPGSMIEIRYPGGEEGSLWAQELIDWLVAS